MSDKKKIKRNLNWKKNIPRSQAQIRLEPSYITKQRMEAKKFIVDNSKMTMEELNKLSDIKIREIASKIKKAQGELALRKSVKKVAENVGATKEEAREATTEVMTELSKVERKAQRKALRKEYRMAKTSFLQNPTLRNQEEAISSRVSYVAGLPKDVSQIVSEYASDPLVLTKTTPKGGQRKPRAINALKMIFENQGVDFDLRDFDQVKDEKGRIVRKSAQASDFVVKQLLDQYVDDLGALKALLGNPSMPNNDPAIREIRALRNSLGSKKTVKQRKDEKETRDIKEAVASSMEEPKGYTFEEEEEEKVQDPVSAEIGTQMAPVTAEIGTQMAPVSKDVYTMYRPRVSSSGTQTKSATEFRRDVERDIRKSMRRRPPKRTVTKPYEDVTPARLPEYKPKSERDVLDELFRPMTETPEDRDVSSLMDWMVDEVVGRETQRMAEEKYEDDDEDQDLTELSPVNAVTASDNIGFSKNEVFKDNFVREVNAGLTGLEQNSSIPLRGRQRTTINQTVDVPEDDEYYANDDYEDKEEQNAELEGPADEWIHGDPNDNTTVQNVNSLLLADNNQYTEAQKAILRRGQANRQLQNRIRKSNLDAVLGEGETPLGQRDDEEKFGDDDEQGGVGGGLGDEGFDEDPEVVQGGDRARQTIQNEIERQLIKPRTKWVGDRGVTADFQRVAIADRIGDSLRNSQSLNAMRKTPIPWKRPSRTYANNYVGLMRNSTRSMILQTNLLEP